MTGWQAVRSGLAVMLLASAGACMAPQPQLAAAPQSVAPLEARIFPPYYGQVAFSVNKPAYTALFEIVPGSGVSMLYPTAGSGFTQVRENWVPLQYSAQRWLYASNRFGDPAPGQWSGFAYGYGMGYGTAGGRGMTYSSTPRYLFLIASEEPIEVSQFQHKLAAVRQYLGPNQYSSYQPYDVMERLAYAMVPYADDDRWVTDVFVDWGYDWGYGATPGTSVASSSWQAIRCADGTVGMANWVPGWGYTAMTCAPWVNGQQAQGPGGDSTGVQVDVPGGRDRTRNAGEEGRSRTGGPESARPQLHGAQSAETRSRIAQLRADAARSEFDALLNRQVRQNVELRHRADALMGSREGSATRGGASRNAARPSSDAGTSGRATRSREEAARRSGERNARRDLSSPSPRSREGTSRPQASTQSAPSSPPPRSREASSSPAPASSPPSSPAPATSEPRSRPPTSH